MIAVTKHGVLLRRTEFDFENEGVLNPAAIQEGNTVHMFYRALHEGNHSTLGYCRFEGPLNIVERYEKPVVVPEAPYESQGVEDARIVKIDGVYYLTYTAYDGVNALGAYATSKKLPYFEKQGVFTQQFTHEEFDRLISGKSLRRDKYQLFNKYFTHNNPESKALVWNKNVVFFPRRIDGKLYFMHRIKPDIQLAIVEEMEDLTPEFWEDHFLNFDDHVLMEPEFPHEISYIGGGCPPIETDQGWLVIYHGVHEVVTGHKYVACATLLDLEDPSKEIARLPYALFEPEYDYEVIGEVDNVCFPTGASVFDDVLYIYYGAADKRIACASMSLSGLLEELMSYAKAEVALEEK